MYAYWVCAARETPISALSFRSGAYHFHKLPKIRSGASPFYLFGEFCRSGDHHFKISLMSTRSSPPTAGSAAVSGRPERQLDASWQFRRLAFSRSKPYQARSANPNCHAQTGSSSIRSPAFSRLPGSSFRSPGQFFTFPRTYLPKFAGSNPPPPPPK